MLFEHAPTERVALDLEHYRTEASTLEAVLEAADAGKQRADAEHEKRGARGKSRGKGNAARPES